MMPGRYRARCLLHVLRVLGALRTSDSPAAEAGISALLEKTKAEYDALPLEDQQKAVVLQELDDARAGRAIRAASPPSGGRVNNAGKRFYPTFRKQYSKKKLRGAGEWKWCPCGKRTPSPINKPPTFTKSTRKNPILLSPDFKKHLNENNTRKQYCPSDKKNKFI